MIIACLISGQLLCCRHETPNKQNVWWCSTCRKALKLTIFGETTVVNVLAISETVGITSSVLNEAFLEIVHKTFCVFGLFKIFFLSLIKKTSITYKKIKINKRATIWNSTAILKFRLPNLWLGEAAFVFV
jgi:hypothetical protein